MSDELNKIKAKIRALSNKTIDNGCTENEAMAAMAMVGRLLNQYNLTMTEVDVREQVCKTVYISTGRKNRHPIDSCIVNLAAAFDCKVWLHTRYVEYVKTTSYAFFGQENDLVMIEYLYKVIFQSIENESHNFKINPVYLGSNSRKTAYVSFQRGMASRIGARLAQMKKQQEEEMQQAEQEAATNPEYNGGRALIVLKGKLVQQEFEKLNMKLRTVQTQARRSDYSAYSQGAAAGNKVNLSRPISGQNSNAGYLT